MNEAMKQAWLEITQMMGEPTQDELHVFLRTWQKAIQAEREECAKVCEATDDGTPYNLTQDCAAAIRVRGQA